MYLVLSLGCDIPNLFSDIKELPFRLDGGLFNSLTIEFTVE